MPFWHLGLTCVIVFLTLGVRRIDYRVVLLGAILPDLIDKPIGRIFFENRFETGRLWGHTFLFVVVLVIGIQLFLRGKIARRWFVLPIAALIHLVLDGMWNLPITLFWPLFGTRFPPEPVQNYWLDVIMRFSDPWVVVQELIGLGVLVCLYRAFGLQDPQRRREFVRQGKVFTGREDSEKQPPEPAGG